MQIYASIITQKIIFLFFLKYSIDSDTNIWA